ncbi:hypothetical protein [Shewanella sp. UCD-KL12]|uniref:hypothetical protein n=1 Tax=Shewanella sp. UCD-KL12 TaxID=1917163 RepID=UPI0009714245|nr:hypothetical protein [Shewanella sp. UCD-KL12]
MKVNKLVAFLGMVVVSQGVYAAAGDTATATANWQGKVPGVIQSDAFVITGEGGDLVTPIGQLMRTTDGAIVAPSIQLEARDNTGTVAAPIVGELVSTTTRDDGAGSTEARAITWAVSDVAFFANGTPVAGLDWSVMHDGIVLATSTASGVTQISSHAGDILKLNALSTSASADIDMYTGKDAALSVTVIASEI